MTHINHRYYDDSSSRRVAVYRTKNRYLMVPLVIIQVSKPLTYLIRIFNTQVCFCLTIWPRQSIFDLKRFVMSKIPSWSAGERCAVKTKPKPKKEQHNKHARCFQTGFPSLLPSNSTDGMEILEWWVGYHIFQKLYCVQI